MAREPQDKPLLRVEDLTFQRSLELTEETEALLAGSVLAGRPRARGGGPARWSRRWAAPTAASTRGLPARGALMVVSTFRVAYPFYSPLPDQVRTIRAFDRPVILVDDMLHDGKRIRAIAPLLAQAGATVRQVLVGYLTGVGRDTMEQLGWPVDSVYYLPNLRMRFVQVGGRPAAQVIGHAAALVRAQGQDHRLPQAAEGQVPGVEGAVLRFQGEEDVPGVLQTDVGSTLAMGLRLLGGDVISALGICDLREAVSGTKREAQKRNTSQSRM